MPLETPFILKLAVILLMIWLISKAFNHLQLTSSFELRFSRVSLTAQSVKSFAVRKGQQTVRSSQASDAQHQCDPRLCGVMRAARKEAQTQAKASQAAAKDAKPPTEMKPKGMRSKAKALPKSPLIVPDSNDDKSDDDKIAEAITLVPMCKLAPFKMDVDSNILMFSSVPSGLKFHKTTGIVKVEETPVKVHDSPAPVIHPESAVAILKRTSPNDLPIKCPRSGSFYRFDHNKEYQVPNNLSSTKGRILEDVSKDIIEHGTAMVKGGEHLDSAYSVSFIARKSLKNEITTCRYRIEHFLHLRNYFLAEAQKLRDEYHAKQSSKGAVLPPDCPSSSKIAMTLVGEEITYV
ncbi:hypothetical protein B0H10DRAFT_1950835 [Mycena sp. CBHHK59/15]|nr:hypothetical protein B0H10DRAFT_1950835 [Mycena sp. CBHHK59/15]